jgi:formylglycine-generating enzyme required for sulfatase activity
VKTPEFWVKIVHFYPKKAKNACPTSHLNKPVSGKKVAQTRGTSILCHKILREDIEMKAKKNNGIGRMFAVVVLLGLVFTGCSGGGGGGGGDPVAVTGVTLIPKTLALLVGGEPETLTPTVSPANATNKAVTWSSNDEEVATVSANGLVTAVAEGEATITVTTADGGFSDTCAVTVHPSVIQEIANNMLQITGGTFTMGSPAGEAGRNSDETEHSVTLTKNFKMSKFQVTQEQYEAVTGSNPSNFKTAITGEDGTPGKLPVERVSWYDAIVFCNKLSMMEGLDPVYSISDSTDPDDWGAVPTSSDATWNAVVMVPNTNGYRLPTEAEWEYACRAGKTTAFNDGNDDYTDATEVGKVAWYTSNAGSKTHQVGLKTPNDYGLYDMHGNVYEWCWDWYGTYASGAQSDPDGAVTGAYRVMRGGYWGDSARYLRSAYRYISDPDFRGHYIGFRLVRSLQ